MQFIEGMLEDVAAVSGAVASDGEGGRMGDHMVAIQWVQMSSHIMRLIVVLGV